MRRAPSGVNNPSYQNLDLQIAKNTRFGHDDRYNFQCRVEMFNALNHPVWALRIPV